MSWIGPKAASHQNESCSRVVVAETGAASNRTRLGAGAYGMSLVDAQD